MRHGDWKLEGDPTEGALLTLALKADPERLRVNRWLVPAMQHPHDESHVDELRATGRPRWCLRRSRPA